MSTKKHRPGINDGYLVTRRLKIEGLSAQNKESLTNQIDRLMGVDGVSLFEDKNLLKVAYDGSKLGINELEEIIESQHCHLAQDWWSRWKLGWYRSTDKNIKDNAAYVPHCCNKPPK